MDPVTVRMNDDATSTLSKDEQKEEVAVDKTNSDKRGSNDKKGTTTATPASTERRNI
jgi:hypothetical protein